MEGQKKKKKRTFAIMKDPKLLNIELGRIRPDDYASLPPSGTVVVLDNIRSAHNIGSIFRTSDAFKVDCVYLCGICAFPPSAEMHKSALGAELSMPWVHEKDTVSLVKRLHDEGYVVVSVEQTHNAVQLQDFVPGKGERYALVFGNEVDGVSQDVVDASDCAVEIPQFGSKHSLNVSVSAGVVLWHFCKQLL